MNIRFFFFLKKVTHQFVYKDYKVKLIGVLETFVNLPFLKNLILFY